MPINVPSTPTSKPFLTAQPVVEFWDETGTPQWRKFALGRMYLDKLTLRLFNQGISEAMLRYECGDISFELGQFGPISPLSIDRTWIRVTITTDDTNIVGGLPVAAPKTITWGGLVTRTEEINRASSGGARLITQKFTARGMEFLFSRRQIVTSEILPAKQILYGLTFNAHSDASVGRRTVKGNRSKNIPTAFSNSDQDSVIWSGDIIVKYLQLTQFPIGAWKFAIDNLELLKWIEPVIVCHGRSLFDVLRALVSPRRGLGSHIFYTAGGTDLDFGTFTYRVNSMFPTGIKLPSGKAIAANENIVNIVASTHRDAFTTINTDSSRRYDKVVATGAPIGAIASFSEIDSTLGIGWLTKDRDDYKSGDPNVQTIDDLSRQRDQHDRYRRQKLPQVFTEFHVPLNWNARVRGGEVGSIQNAFFHLVGDIHVKEMRFASYLPLNVGWDYQSIRPQPTVRAPTVDQFRKPFVVFELMQTIPDSTDQAWEYGHELKNIDDETDGENGFDFWCLVRPLDRRLGVSVKPSTVQHVMSTSATSEEIDFDTSDQVQSQVSYTKMILTAYVQAHELATGEHPKNVVATAENTHFLRLGETAFFDIAIKGTVVDVLGGRLVRTGVNVIVRDDRKYLEDVARIAFRWYGFDRIASQIRYQQITAGATRGNLIGALDDVTANAMVSSVAWDFTNQTTEIFTHFAEPDFAELASR